MQFLSSFPGFHADLAKPDSADPVARQSSRLCVVGTLGGQTSYDPLVIKEWIGGRAWEHPALLSLFACKTFDDYNNPEVRKLAADSAAINHYGKDSPPIFMIYGEPDVPLPPDAKPGQGIHHPIFGKKLKEKADMLGLECEMRITGDNKSPPAHEAMMEFMRDKLLAPVK